eukprot:scaffold13823_cov129-Isochrysis_galbana.AAC.1
MGRSKRQHCIALSSCEAEIMAASQAATEVTYFRGIMRDLGLDEPNPTPLYVDNTGAEELARELKSCARSPRPCAPPPPLPPCAPPPPLPPCAPPPPLP